MPARILQAHAARYPRLQVQDLYKLSQQAAFGAEHAGLSRPAAEAALRLELAELPREAAGPALETISANGDLARAHLGPYLAAGGQVEALVEAFVRTAHEHRARPGDLRLYWAAAIELAKSGELPFAPAEVQAYFAARQAEGFPAVRHSDVYRAAYRPHYRVVAASLLADWA